MRPFPQLLESELFGHEKAPSPEPDNAASAALSEADGGTIFLDEIGEIDAGTQVRLLRVLSERTIERVGSNASIPVNVRVIAATNKSLKKLVQEGKIPGRPLLPPQCGAYPDAPLRDRREDIPCSPPPF